MKINSIILVRFKESFVILQRQPHFNLKGSCRNAETKREGVGEPEDGKLTVGDMYMDSAFI